MGRSAFDARLYRYRVGTSGGLARNSLFFLALRRIVIGNGNRQRTILVRERQSRQSIKRC
jgi:hypothetical protein